MPRTFPWHSETSGLYHNNTDCKSGKVVAQNYRREGTGGKRLCPQCDELNRGEHHTPVSRDKPDYSMS